MIMVDSTLPTFLSGHRWSTRIVDVIPMALPSRILDEVGTKDDLKEGCVQLLTVMVAVRKNGYKN